MSKRSVKRKHKQLKRKKPKNWCQVYVLKDLGGQIFYVGQTTTLPDIRLGFHIKHVHQKMDQYKNLSPCQARIASIIAKNALPVIEIIDKEGMWDISEAVWIDRLTRDGHKLTNILSRVA